MKQSDIQPLYWLGR